VTDPQGVAWETFHTLGSAPTFSAPTPTVDTVATACCAPKKAVGIPVVAAKSCC
jgi:hypothetical protein